MSADDLKGQLARFIAIDGQTYRVTEILGGLHRTVSIEGQGEGLTNKRASAFLTVGTAVAASASSMQSGDTDIGIATSVAIATAASFTATSDTTGIVELDIDGQRIRAAVALVEPQTSVTTSAARVRYASVDITAGTDVAVVGEVFIYIPIDPLDIAVVTDVAAVTALLATSAPTITAQTSVEADAALLAVTASDIVSDIAVQTMAEVIRPGAADIDAETSVTTTGQRVRYASVAIDASPSVSATASSFIPDRIFARIAWTEQGNGADGSLHAAYDSFEGFTSEEVDSSFYFEETDIQVDDDGNLHVAYEDVSNGALRYGFYDGSWTTEEVYDGSSISGERLSLALDSSGNPSIVFSYRGASVAWLIISKSGGSWGSPTTIDSGWTGSSSVSYQIDPSNDRGQIALYGNNGTNGFGFYHAYFNGTSWTTPAKYGTPPDNSGRVRLVLDSSGLPHVAYDQSTTDEVRYTYSTSLGSFETHETVTTGTQISSLQCGFDLDSEGNAHIAYVDEADLWYATNASGSWVTEEVDDSQFLRSISLRIDQDSNPHIAYSRGSGTSYDIWIAFKDSFWETTKVQEVSVVADYVSMALWEPPYTVDIAVATDVVALAERLANIDADIDVATSVTASADRTRGLASDIDVATSVVADTALLATGDADIDVDTSVTTLGAAQRPADTDIAVATSVTASADIFKTADADIAVATTVAASASAMKTFTVDIGVGTSVSTDGELISGVTEPSGDAVFITESDLIVAE